MSNFFQNHFKSLLEYTTSAFEEIVAQMSSRGKRALKVLEIGAGEILCSKMFNILILI